MSRAILLRLVSTEGEMGDLTGRLRNFGEDVFRQLRDAGWGEVDLHEVDRATRSFTITRVKESNCRRLMLWLEHEAARQHLSILLDLLPADSDA